MIIGVTKQLERDLLPRHYCLDLALYAIKRSDPYISVRENITYTRKELVIKNKRISVRGKIYIAGIGKASCRMARAVEEIIGDDIEYGVVSTKYGYGEKLEKIKVIEAGHPLPDENSLRAADEIIGIARQMKPEDILIFLISGGGSALFTKPYPPITLDELIKTHDLLVKSGARIQEINTVRKHISLVKGGRFAKMVPGKIISLIVSDVVGDDLSTIASGPTAPDPTTYADAKRILINYDLWDKVPENVQKVIDKGLRGDIPETPKNLSNVDNNIIASANIAAEHSARRALELGLKPAVMTTTIEGEARHVGTAIASIIEEIVKNHRPFKPPVCLIFAGETVVTVKGEAGTGGPNQELALSASMKIRGYRGVALIALDTDGTDGPTDAAGGLVDSKTYDILMNRGVDPEKSLMRHDAYNALKISGDLIKTGSTGTNVNSIIIAVILR